MSLRRGVVERQRAIEEVLVQLFSVLLCSGKSVEDARAAANSCIESARKALQVREKIRDEGDAQDFGSILRTWHRQAKYLTSDGFPRPLQLAGRNGLRALIGQYYPQTQIDEILTALTSAGLIKMTKRSLWTPTGKYAVFPRMTAELLEHLSEGVSRLVETVIGNVTTENKDEVLFERSAKVRQFPAGAASEFREFTNSQAVAFLGAVDDWMEARADSAKGKKGKKCTAGVFTFAFMDKLGRQRTSFRRNRETKRSSR
jgi:hypothetical protein